MAKNIIRNAKHKTGNPLTTIQYVWMNGKLVKWEKATVHVMTHALHYGTAIFEGMRCYETIHGPAVFRMKDHYRRLIEGAKSYEFTLSYSADELRKATKNLILKNHMKSGYLRPICYSSKVTVGLDIFEAPFSFAIIVMSLGKFYGKKMQTGLACEISSWERINAAVLSPHVKASANYLNSALAKLEARNAGYDEAILLSENGHVSEATGENIFVVSDGELVTPPIYDGILDGITRDSIITLARELGIKVSERSILRDELYTADEVFLCGTAAEITPVASVDRRKISNGPGKMTKQVMDAYEMIVAGKDDRFMNWLDFVKEPKK